MNNRQAKFDEQLKEEGRLNALIAENLATVGTDLSAELGAKTREGNLNILSSLFFYLD